MSPIWTAIWFDNLWDNHNLQREMCICTKTKTKER